MVVAGVTLPSQGCCEWVGGEKSGGAQGGGGACLGGVLGRCAPGGLLCTLHCRLAASPCLEDPTILCLPLRWKEDAIPPWRHKRPSDLCLTCTAPTAQCVTGPAQLSPPTNIPAGGESPVLCPPQLPCPSPPHPNPSLPWHGFSFIAHLAKSQPDPQPGGLAEEREGSPVPSQSPSTGGTGCAGRAVPGPVPPCEVAGELCGMEVPLHSGSRQARLGEALAGRIQPNQSRLSPSHRVLPQCPELPGSHVVRAEPQVPSAMEVAGS